jgi:hypothetical protein
VRVRRRYWPESDGVLDLSPVPPISPEQLRDEARRLVEALELDSSPDLFVARVREAALPVTDPELAEVVALARRPLGDDADDGEGLDPETLARIDAAVQEQVERDLRMLAADAALAGPPGPQSLVAGAPPGRPRPSLIGELWGNDRDDVIYVRRPAPRGRSPRRFVADVRRRKVLTAAGAPVPGPVEAALARAYASILRR